MAGEPVPLSDRVFLLPGPVNMFLLREGRACAALDTGLTADAGRRLLRGAEALGGELVAILNSHAHADHFGGNAFLLKRTAAEVHAPAQEEAILRYPDLEPFYLFGAAPPVELTSRFLRAEASRVDRILGGDVVVAGLRVRPIPAPGHSINQHAFQVDDVFLAIDALFGEEALAKHQVAYRYSPKRHRETSDHLQGIQARITVPSHGPPTAEGQGLVEANRRNLEATRRATLEALASPGLAEEVAARVTAMLGLQPTLEGYYLNLSTIKGHLAALRAEGLAAFCLEQGRLLWDRR